MEELKIVPCKKCSVIPYIGYEIDYHGGCGDPECCGSPSFYITFNCHCRVTNSRLVEEHDAIELWNKINEP